MLGKYNNYYDYHEEVQYVEDYDDMDIPRPERGALMMIVPVVPGPAQGVEFLVRRYRVNY